MFYPIQLEPDTNGTLLVSFPDLPWVHTYGTDEADALARAAEALDTALEYLVRSRQPVPMPSRGIGHGVTISAMVAAKLGIHNLMLERGITKAELGRRMRVHRQQIDRLMDPHHVSRFDEVERAFGTFGKRIELTVRPELTAPEARHVAQRMRKAARKR